MSVKKYCYCENNCKFETMDKEEILAAIAQAVETGEVGECDTGFITTVKTINGTPLKFFVGAQSEYEALSETQKQNLFAIISNDTTKEGLEATLNTLIADLDSIEKRFDDYCAHRYYHTVRQTIDVYSNLSKVGSLFLHFNFSSGSPNLITNTIDSWLKAKGTYYISGEYLPISGDEVKVNYITVTDNSIMSAVKLVINNSITCVCNGTPYTSSGIPPITQEASVIQLY